MSKVIWRLDNLDLLRGIAALAVLGEHLRAYVFQSYFDLSQSGGSISAIARLFYFATGLGHQAVMVFFALSGFLVGGTALNSMLSGTFSWSRYLLRRLTRLWIVIIPALTLTFLFDGIGMHFGAGYDGRYYDLYSSGPHSPEGVSHSFATLVGNLAFLQTIEVPTFGTNGPLWSLANEFWYYIVFPMAAWLAWGRAPYLGKAVGLIILLSLVYFLPTWLLTSGSIWVAGAVAAWVCRQAVLLTFLRALGSRIAALALLFTVLLVTKLPTVGFGDLGLGIAVAVTLPVIAHLPNPGGGFKLIARGLSEISYTLYLTHFPFLTLIVMTGFAPTKWPPGMFGVGVYVGLLAAAIGWAGVIWWLFERNTDRVYSMLARQLISPKVALATTEATRALP